VVVPREDANPPKRYNQFVVEDAYAGQLYEHPACPATRIGVRVSDLALPALAAVFGDQAASASTVASHARVMPQKNGRGVVQGGKLMTWIQRRLHSSKEEMTPISCQRILLWRRLQML